MLTFFFVFFCFVYLVPPSLPPSWIVFLFLFFCKKRKISSETVLISTQRNTQTPQTGAIKHWSLEKQHTNTHTCTTFVLLYFMSSLLLTQTINPQWEMTRSTEQLSTPQVLLGALNLSELSKVFKPLWYITINTDHHEFLIHNKNTPFIFNIIWTFWCTLFM